MKNPFRIRYKIVSDKFLGYEVRAKRWFWPFWYQVDFTNTFSTIEKAKKFIDGKKGIEVYEIN